jgi:hypothetical protein
MTIKEQVHADLTDAGYSTDEIERGFLWAAAHNECGWTYAETKSAVLSRILYSDAQLEDGARWSVEA